MVLFSAAWTWGMAIPAKAEAAASFPVVVMKSRRVLVLASFIMDKVGYLADGVLPLSIQDYFGGSNDGVAGMKPRRGGVANGTRTRNIQNHNLGLYH